MSILPSLKRCPCCAAINLVKINGIVNQNIYQIFAAWNFKKKFNCRKCKEELGLFVHPTNLEEKLVWLSYLECEDCYHNEMLKLQNEKIKRSKNINKKYYETLKNIETIQNKIAISKTKLKIKLKIKSKGMLIRHVY